MSSYQLLVLMHHLCRYMRICLFYWPKEKRAYIFYNQIDRSSNPGSATYHVNLDRLFNLSDTQIFFVIASTLQHMMRHQWDNEEKHLPQCPAGDSFSANTGSLPPAYPKESGSFEHMRPGLSPSSSPPHWMSRDAQISTSECGFRDSPIDHSRLDYFLYLSMFTS